MIHLISGPPRSGKTTLAKAISKKHGISWVSADCLEVISRAYVPKSKWKEKYPYRHLRAQGKKRDNDIFYATHSTQKIVSVLKKQEKATHLAIDMFIAHELHNGNNYIIEGYQIDPIFAEKIIKKYDKKNVSYICLTKFDANKFAKDVHKSTTPNDWLLILTKQHETFVKVGEMVAAYSKWFEKEAKKRKFKVVNMDKNFTKNIEQLSRSMK